MVMYPPTPRLSEADKKLLELLEKVMCERLGKQSVNSNLRENHVALSDNDAEDLERRLNEFVNSKEFLEASYFVEIANSADDTDEKRAKEIYLAARARQDRSRAMASAHWENFKRRLGVGRQKYRGEPSPMSHSYFRRMEMRLFSSAGLNEDVVNEVMKTIDDQKKEIESLRMQHKTLRHGIIKEALTKLLSSSVSRFTKLQDRQISVTRVAAAITVIGNTSVLFTTRDWSITGTLSTMAGALAAASAD